MIRRIVLLPEPDGPSKATSCPVGTSNETPSTAWNLPNRFERFLTTMPTSCASHFRPSWPVSFGRFVRFDPLAEELHADEHDEGDATQEDAGGVGPFRVEALD